MLDAVQMVGEISVQNAFASRFVLRSNQMREKAAIESAAKEFGAMFMAQMLQPMFEGIEVNELTGGGHGEEIMRSLLVQEYGKAVAQGVGSGLSDAIKSELIRVQADRQQRGNL